MWLFRRKAPKASDTTIANVGDPNLPGAPVRVLTVLSPQQQMELGGLPAEAIAGTIEPGSELHPDGFRVNPVFVDFMQHVIATFGRDEPDLQEAARRQVTGSVGVIDLRTPEGPQGRVPMEDIVGIFAVEDGRLGAYHPNGTHIVLSRHGLVRLPPQLHALHVRELMRLRVTPS